MERQTTTLLRIGEWCVNSSSGQISREGETARLEARTMRLLLCLAEHVGEVVSIEDLLNQVWPGVSVTPDSVYQAVASLRRLLGDDPRQPAYIATVPRLGYRLVATVKAWEEESTGQTDAPRDSDSELPALWATDAPVPKPRQALALYWAIGAMFCLALVIGFLVRHGTLDPSFSSLHAIASPRQQSIAVLPFLDLTEEMNQEPFADGMTEELIDKFSKIPGLHVASPTSSFYFKGKQIPVAKIGKTLGVACVLDGSVRKSGTRLRVAARLVLADNGYVIWSETYDRPLEDILQIQDEIADEVTKRLRASIEARPDDDKPH